MKKALILAAFIAVAVIAYIVFSVSPVKSVSKNIEEKLMASEVISYTSISYADNKIIIEGFEVALEYKTENVIIFVNKIELSNIKRDFHADIQLSGVSVDYAENLNSFDFDKILIKQADLRLLEKYDLSLSFKESGISNLQIEDDEFPPNSFLRVDMNGDVADFIMSTKEFKFKFKTRDIDSFIDFYLTYDPYEDDDFDDYAFDYDDDYEDYDYDDDDDYGDDDDFYNNYPYYYSDDYYNKRYYDELSSIFKILAGFQITDITLEDVDFNADVSIKLGFIGLTNYDPDTEVGDIAIKNLNIDYMGILISLDFAEIKKIGLRDYIYLVVSSIYLNNLFSPYVVSVPYSEANVGKFVVAQQDGLSMTFDNFKIPQDIVFGNIYKTLEGSFDFTIKPSNKADEYTKKLFGDKLLGTFKYRRNYDESADIVRDTIDFDVDKWFSSKLKLELGSVDYKSLYDTTLLAGRNITLNSLVFEYQDKGLFANNPDLVAGFYLLSDLFYDLDDIIDTLVSNLAYNPDWLKLTVSSDNPNPRLDNYTITIESADMEAVTVPLN